MPWDYGREADPAFRFGPLSPFGRQGGNFPKKAGTRTHEAFSLMRYDGFQMDFFVQNVTGPFDGMGFGAVLETAHIENVYTEDQIVNCVCA